MQKLPSPVLRERLKDADVRITTHQVVAKDGRKLARVAIESDPWSVTAWRGLSPLDRPGGYLDHAMGETVDAAVLELLGRLAPRRGLLSAMARLEGEVVALTRLL